MPKMNMVQAINLALHQEMTADDRVLVLGQDVGVNEGVFRVTAGLFKTFGERRVIDTPLAESGILGTSIGMALAGLRPVAEIQFSGFSYLMMGQLEGHASRFRSRTLGSYSCPLVVRMPYGGGVRALEHHSESREAMFAHVPGIKVVIPSSPRNARALMSAAIRDPDAVVFMEPKRSYRAFREEVPEEPEQLPLGKARVVQDGSDLTVISWGAMMPLTAAAADAVQRRRGAKIELIDLMTISPLDTSTVVSSVRKTGRCVIVQEAPRSFSTSSELIARINDHALMHLEAPVRRVTGYDVVTPYFSREEPYFPTSQLVERGLEETLDFHS